jgi:general secretion pathway protein A
VPIDEAQEMHPAVLNELRLLTSQHFDSRTLLSVILAGDARRTAKLRRAELLALGSRIRTRLNREYASREVLLQCLKHLQNRAGNASLMTAELMSTLAAHALGNYRLLTTMAAELLATAAQQERPQLYLEVFGTPAPAAHKRA